jgi:uroporphyrinogen-III decarboxylase
MKDIGGVRKKTGKNVSLLGNIPPMSLARNTPDEVYDMSLACINSYIAANGSTKGLLLSVGGGVPMDATGECINAVVKAAKSIV